MHDIRGQRGHLRASRAFLPSFLWETSIRETSPHKGQTANDMLCVEHLEPSYLPSLLCNSASLLICYRIRIS